MYTLYKCIGIYLYLYPLPLYNCNTLAQMTFVFHVSCFSCKVTTERMNLALNFCTCHHLLPTILMESA